MTFKYIDLIQKAGVIPNFYISDEYFYKAGFLEDTIYMDHRYWIIVMDGDWMVFPPISSGGTFSPRDVAEIKKVALCQGIWSDFKGYDPINATPVLLDHEFLYDPKDFLNISGSKWEVFRKNSRKFPNRLNKPLTYISIPPGYGRLNLVDSQYTIHIEDAMDSLAIEWLSGFSSECIIQDDNTLLEFLRSGMNRKILVDCDGTVYGVNIWDENYRYINYRYCITRRIPYLSECMRLRFYTDPEILAKNKLVNDGGNLGAEKLYNFKMKLNPLSVRTVNSWI